MTSTSLHGLPLSPTNFHHPLHPVERNPTAQLQAMCKNHLFLSFGASYLLFTWGALYARKEREQTLLVYPLPLTDSFTELSPSCTTCSTQQPFIILVAPLGTFLSSLFFLRWGSELHRLITTDLLSAVEVFLFLLS